MNSISRLINNHRFFCIAAASGLLIRAVYLLEFSYFVNFDLAIGADVGEYAARAKEILNGIFWPAVPEIHAPFYSFFLAFIQLAGGGVVTARIIQTLLNLLSWWVLFFLAEKVGVQEKTRRFFLVTSMVLAPLIFHPAEMISESLLLPLFTGVFLLLTMAKAASGKRQMLFDTGAGTLSALAVLTHGLALPFAAAEILFCAIRREYRKCLCFSAGVLLLLLPFIFLKSLHYGRLMGVQNNTVFNLFLGNNPKADGKCYLRPGLAWRKAHQQAASEAAKRNCSADSVWLERVMDYWKNNPLQGVKLYLKKVPIIFSGNEHIAGADGGFLFCRSETTYILRHLTFPVMCFAFFGIYALWKKRREEAVWSEPLLLAAALFLAQVLTVTSGRYRLMMFPGLIYLAAAGMSIFNWKRYYAIPVFLVCGSVFFTYTFFARDRAEGTALLGEGYFRKGEFVHAKELLIYAGRRFRDPSRIDNMLGNIAEREKNLPEARKYYSRVTRLEPFMPEGWMNLANVTPDPAKAGKYFLKAIEVSGNSPSADLCFNYARFLYSVRKGAECEKWLHRAIQISPQADPALNFAGILAMNKREFAKAVDFFHRAARVKPAEKGYWNNMRIAALHAGKRELADQAARKLSELSR